MIDARRASRASWSARTLETIESLFGGERVLPGLFVGFASAIILIAVVLGLHPSTFQAFNRSGELGDAVRAFGHGLPLMAAQTSRGATYPAGLGDDLGLFALGPLFGRVLGISDPLLIARLMILVCFVPVVVVAPLLFRRITGSAVAAVVAPIGLVFAAIGFEITPYWASAWAVLGLLPAVLWIDARWSPVAGPLILTLAVLAGVASALRSYAGAPVVLAILLTLATRAPWRMPVRALVAVLAIVAYLLVSSTAVSAIENHRDDYGPIAARYPDALHGHVFWHTVYIGLGYLPNDQHIWWDDGVGLRAARRRDPGVVYLTQRYESDMQNVTLDLIRSHPGLVISTYIKKLAVAITWGAPLLLVLLLTLPIALRTERARTRRAFLLAAPAVLIGIVPALLGLPIPEYLYGWLSALTLLSVVTVSLAGDLILRRRAGRDGIGSAWLRELLRTRRALATGCAIVLLLAVSAWGVAIRSQANAWAQRNGGILASVS